MRLRHVVGANGNNGNQDDKAVEPRKPHKSQGNICDDTTDGEDHETLTHSLDPLQSTNKL
jgi:hypothetical protein